MMVQTMAQHGATWYNRLKHQLLRSNRKTSQSMGVTDLFFELMPEKHDLGTMGHPIGWATVPANPPKRRESGRSANSLKEGSNKTNQQQRATLLFNLRSESEIHRKVHLTHKITPIHENGLYNGIRNVLMKLLSCT